MSINILAILACVPLYVINSVCDKMVSSRSECNYIYNCIKFIICSVCMVYAVYVSGVPAFSWGVLICGGVCGIMYAVSKTIMLKGYENTSVAFMTLCHSAGMILPCVLGHFLWNEKLSFLSVLGIIMTIIAIVLIKGNGGDNKGYNLKGIIFGIIIFLASAGVMIVQKVMGIYYPGEHTGIYNFYSFLVPAFILCLCSKPSVLKRYGRKDKNLIYFCAAGSAVSLCSISFVMTLLASSVPSVILFPLFNGLGIILVCVVSAVWFKEKLNTPKLLGLVLGVLGLYIINL